MKIVFMRYQVLIALFWFFMACHNAPEKKNAGSIEHDQAHDNSFVVQNGLDAEPRLKQADSLQILYYDNPDGDSLRYSRYYRFTSSADSLLMQNVFTDLGQPFERLYDVKKCRSEGKIYLYRKQEPLKTIYFSTRDSCNYIYFIKDGAFLYFSLSEELRNSLKENRKSAKRP